MFFSHLVASFKYPWHAKRIIPGNVNGRSTMSEDKDSSSMLSKKAIGEYIRSKQNKEGKHFMVSSDIWNEVDATIKRWLDKACQRASENGRVTVMTQDI